MTGAEFIRRVQRLGKRRGVDVRFEPRHGKGSHGRLWFGERFTTIQDRKKELRSGTLSAMLRQLGLRLNDL